MGGVRLDEIPVDEGGRTDLVLLKGLLKGC